jgi:D-alanyl-D-alanine carboxypeptidase
MIRCSGAMLQMLMLAVAATAIVFFGGCGETSYISGGASTPPPITRALDAELRQSVEDYLGDMASTGNEIPGAIVGLQLNGYQPWYYATGSAELDLENGAAPKRAMADDMAFRIASITKMFIAQVIVMLEEEGKLSASDTVEKWLPGALTGRNAANADKITIGMLLSHTSGLYSYVTTDAGLLYGNGADLGLPMNRFVMDMGRTPWIRSADPQVDEVLRFVNDFEPPVTLTTPSGTVIGNPYGTNPYFAPGAGFHYSNTNYYLLGLIIEKVTGNSVGAEIQRLIAGPLGLSNTYLPTDTTFRTSNFVHGYTDYFNGDHTGPLQIDMLRFQQVGGGWINGDGVLEDFSFVEPSFAWTTGGMVSSARDLMTFMQFVMTTRVQSRQEAGHWIQGAPLDTGTSFQYARGIARVDNVMFGHGGQFAGYNVAAYWIAPIDAYIVIMTNRYSYFESDPNHIGGSIAARQEQLYKTAASASEDRTDPNTGIINRVLSVLDLGAPVSSSGKAAAKAATAPLTRPDTSSQPH